MIPLSDGTMSLYADDILLYHPIYTPADFSYLQGDVNNICHSIKYWQLKAIWVILEGENSLIVQPTGSGKSLCYQFPCTVTQKITIVLTPTISLMMDQVESLISTGLWATFLGSAQKNTTVTAKVAQGQFDIIFCTPVQSSGGPKPLFRTLLSLISLVAGRHSGTATIVYDLYIQV